MIVRIAVVQFRITHLHPSKNFARIETFIQKAKTQHADIVVFPEDCVTGSIFGDVSRLDTTHATRQAFQKLASKYRIDVVTGSCMEGTPDGNFNTSYYIDAQGTVLGTYHKNHLYLSERRFLSAGTVAPVFDTKWGKAAIVICWDMLFSEIFQRLMKGGVQLIYCPSYWYQEIAESMALQNPRSEEEQMDALCLTRALETNSVLIYSNAAGIQRYKNNTRDTLIGHSQITMPVLGTVQKLNHHREQMFVQEVDLDLLKKAESIYQTRADFCSSP